MFAAGWIAMSLCLHQLLVFYPERPAAQIVARKKFIISRIGDVCLIAALALIWNAFGSLDFKTLFAAAQAAGANGVTAADFHAIAGLLVIGALLKSAQFPFHGWLPEVMETPTPVSALLHAGIINAGGFLIVRMSDVVGLSTPALNVLAIVGATTALFGALTMLTQNSIKVWLAHSTIAQMGFMMLQCGLGAFSSAVLHIVAHALYKAHAFLSSGSVVEIAKSSWTPSASGRPHPIRMLGALTAAVALVFAVGLAFGVTPEQKPGMLVLGAVLLMSITQLMWNSYGEFRTTAVALRGAALSLAVCVAYFALQIGFEHLLAPALPIAHATRGVFDLALLAGVTVTFMAVVVLQMEFPYQVGRPGWQRLFVLLFNGFYVNTVANRIVGRLWPVELSAAAKGGN
jgi:NAD(P)H-quinone oxidoreductase subunit 5